MDDELRRAINNGDLPAIKEKLERTWPFYYNILEQVYSLGPGAFKLFIDNHVFLNVFNTSHLIRFLIQKRDFDMFCRAKNVLGLDGTTGYRASHSVYKDTTYLCTAAEWLRPQFVAELIGTAEDDEVMLIAETAHLSYCDMARNRATPDQRRRYVETMDCITAELEKRGLEMSPIVPVAKRARK